MRPGELWPQMQAGHESVMRASLHLGTETALLCLRGGMFREGELALRLPGEVDVHRLLVDWDGLNITRGAAETLPGQQLVRIAPADEGYRDLYVHLADDIHDHLAGTTTSAAAVQIILSRLRLWSGFLRRNTRSLDERTVRGLFAELCALERVLLPSLGWEGALAAWTGPSGMAQDVMTDSLALDVKATQLHDSLVTISSIEQLDPPGGRAVRLLQVAVSEGSGVSLHQLIDRLSTLASAAGAGSMFAARLTQAGVSPTALNTLEEHPMTVVNWTNHRADDPGFPRLKRTDVHAGIVGASYRIDLARSTAVPADLQEIHDLLQQTRSGEGT